MTINEVLKQTDWTLLAEQKLALLRAIEQEPNLEGLLNWIDALQDAAESEGFPVVFLTESDEAQRRFR